MPDQLRLYPNLLGPRPGLNKAMAKARSLVIHCFTDKMTKFVFEVSRHQERLRRELREHHVDPPRAEDAHRSAKDVEEWRDR